MDLHGYRNFAGRRAVFAAALVVLMSGCSMHKVERREISPDEFKSWPDESVQKARKDSPFLKVHMRNGDLFVLDEWRFDETHSSVLGIGAHYDAWRDPVGAGGNQSVPVDSVALFETNRLVLSGAAVGLTVMMGVTVGIAIYCAANPKACFGSCPTFYLAGIDRPVAEGFSASISPSLEATDIDALPAGIFHPGPFVVEMKNEAMETHVVRHVDLLAAPRYRGQPVFHAGDSRLLAVKDPAPPVAALGDEGDCLAPLAAADGVERFVPADSTDLAGKEIVYLTFADASAGPRALVVGCRQTLLSTYVLYQAFAYMGRDAGYWLSQVERGEIREAGAALSSLFASITVRVESGPDEWVDVGRVSEFGPIAVDHHVIPFDAPQNWTGRVALQMTRGGWRIDDVALGRAGDEVQPVRLQPREVLRDGDVDVSARAILLDPARSLTTLPGDAYRLVYDLPDDGTTYDLFLESRGYYLEWIRNEWIDEEDGALLTELFVDPHAGLRRMAPEFKRLEPDMERVFWSSRYAKP
ncbi:MAG TPA: hypothetical protein VFH88_06720 [Candidatus Krumholzibacteria bacterium]|nr:hypothetical protein [Candidatus Krumholzibacteria bacterium]